MLVLKQLGDPLETDALVKAPPPASTGTQEALCSLQQAAL
jgi:hypothetical protein